MDDLRERFRAVDRLEVRDLWHDVSTRVGAPAPAGRRPARWVAAVVAAAVAGAGIAFAVATLGGIHHPELLTAPARPQVSEIRVRGLSRLAAGDGAVWALGATAVRRVDPRTGSVGSSIRLPHRASALAVGGSALWAGGYAEGPNDRACHGRRPCRQLTVKVSYVMRIDLVTGRVRSIPIGHGFSPQAIASSFGSIWVAEGADVLRLDPGTGRVLARVHACVTADAGFAEGFGSLWAAGVCAEHEVTRIDPRTNRVVATLEGDGVAVGGGMVWIRRDESLQRIDPRTNALVGTAHLGSGAAILGDGSLWVVRTLPPDRSTQRKDASFEGLSIGNDVLYRVDPGTFALLTSPVEVRFPPGDGIVAFGSLWIRSGAHTLIRIDARAGGPTARPYYADGQALAARLETATGQCTDFTPEDQSFPFPGETVGTCTIEGSRVTIRVYLIERWFRPAVRLRTAGGSNAVVGTNWFVVSTDPAARRTVARALAVPSG